MSGLSLGTCTSNLKSVALTILNWSDWPVCYAQMHTQTHVKRNQYLCHSLHSFGGDNNVTNIPAGITTVIVTTSYAISILITTGNRQRHTHSKTKNNCELIQRSHVNYKQFKCTRNDWIEHIQCEQWDHHLDTLIGTLLILVFRQQDCVEQPVAVVWNS